MVKVARIPNPLAGLVYYIRTEIKKNVNWIDPPVGDHVYSGGLPKEIIESHKAINSVCMNEIPSPEDGSEAPRREIMVDCVSYGIDFEVAGDVDMAVYAILKPLRGTVIKFKDRGGNAQSLYVYSAIISGGMQSRDQDLDWPCVLRPYRIRVGERSEFN